MQALKELVFLANRHNVKTSGFFQDDQSMLSDFYQQILKGKIDSDEDAASYFYDGDAQSPRYQKLKNNLLKKMHSMVFFLDNPNASSFAERNTAYYECYKEWATAKILLGKNARVSGIRLSHKVIRQAKKFEFTELILDIARTLRLHYSTREGDAMRYEKYNALYKEYVEIWNKEHHAEELYSELILHYVNNKASKEDTHQKAVEYYSILQNDLKKNDSYMLNFCGYLIQMIIPSSINQHDETIRICDEMIKFFENKPYFARVPIQIANYQKLICYTQLKDYQSGRKVADHCLDLVDEGSFNWFKFQELYFLLAMHTGEYQEAYEIFLQVIEDKQFQFLPEAIKETWNIFKAYLHFLMEVDKLTPAPHDKSFSKFRLGKFLNDTPIFSRDKMGMNIPILIIQILFMIKQKNYDQAVDRIDAIEKYISRYLRKDETFRSHCFIRMLLQIPASGFHRAGVVRNAKKFRNKLEEVNIPLTGQNYEIEIIPYEVLWEHVIESLDTVYITV